MRFGRIPAGEADGAVLAHALVLADGRIGKGTRLGRDHLALIAAAGIGEVIAARLDPGDIGEDEAAAALGAALAAPGIEAAPAATGRANLFARAAGLLVPDAAAVDALNAVDPGITLATLPAFAPVRPGAMVATVKIIPLAVPGRAVEAARAVLASTPALALKAFRPHRIALVQTELAGIKRTVLDKTRRVLDARLEASGSTVVEERRCRHDTAALAETLGGLGPTDLVVVFGASAVIDRADVVPAAVESAGGTVRHLGMPVDPGNLLLLATFRGRPLLGAPGCARSPKENGFDWVLDRFLAGLEVAPDDIRRLGVGGLLMEIPSRPQPREAATP